MLIILPGCALLFFIDGSATSFTKNEVILSNNPLLLLLLLLGSLLGKSLFKLLIGAELSTLSHLKQVEQKKKIILLKLYKL